MLTLPALPSMQRIMADDASASVKVSEYAFFNYAGDPVDSIRETVYDVELRKIDDCWFIYNVAEEGWFDGEFSNMTIDEMNDAVSQFLLTDIVPLRMPASAR